MKKEDLFESLKDIREEDVKKARQYKAKKKPVWIRWGTLAACMVITITAFLGSPLFRNGNTDTSPGLTVYEAVYPKPTASNMSAQKFMDSDAHWNWLDTYSQMAERSAELQNGMNGYYAELMNRILVSEDKNTICSPLNTYIAFAMLAEVTDGNTRQQILDMLQVSDIETLRQNIRTIWESNYVDTPILKSLLANSMWLNDVYTYNSKTMKRLAETYYASSFSGNPGSQAMNQALQDWTDKNTGGLLSEHVQDMNLDSDTVLAIVSTIYYKAMWASAFDEQMTTQQTFHGTLHDTTVNMMHMTDSMEIFSNDNFTALGLNLNDSGAMYFYLPNEGVDVNTLASDPDIIAATVFGEGEEWSFNGVNLSVPKFRVSYKTDLLDIIAEMGITDALNPMLSDFTPLTEDLDGLYLSTAEHAAMVEIDEHGVTGAAYTELAITKEAFRPAGEIDFILDRPFMFVITGRDGSILFSGIVRNIE
ncbi:MAG: serpin family protein [Eubacteriaceae bacterium]|nr:serpin family protein [Eubacteriaceae bacterium]